MKPFSSPRRLLLTMGTLLFVAVAAVSAHAQNVQAEDDTWVSGSNTQVDFSGFGNLNIAQLFGSAPVSTVVTFAGVPLNSAIGSADTLLSRGATTFNPTINGTFSATLTLEALSMVSNPDLALTDGRVYHITVTLATVGNGQIDFTTTTAEGGTFTSSFVVTPIFTFTNVNNASDVQTLNCLTNSSLTCSFPLNGSGDWVLTSSTGFDPQAFGIPIIPAGVVVNGYTTIGKPRFGTTNNLSIQVACGGTKAAGYHCGHPVHDHAQQLAHHPTLTPADCATPAPSPTPTPTGGTGGGCAVKGINETGGGCSTGNIALATIGGGPGPSPTPAPSPSPTPQPLCSN